MARVLALVPDLMFGSKVVEMLGSAGHEVDLIAQEHEAWDAADAADVLVVDLATEELDGVTLVDTLRADGELHSTRTLGFYAHVDDDARRRAEGVGFDLVVPRSRMAREGAELVAGLVGAT